MMYLSAILIVPLAAAASQGPLPRDPDHQSHELRDGVDRSDWPQWRGPRRDAVSHEVGLVQQWPAHGPDVMWRVGAGDGFSGIAVSGGGVFTMWDEEGAQLLVGLDATSGARLWSTPVGDEFEHPYGNGPRSTPLVDGEVVFAIGTSGRLLAVNRHTGVALWELDLVQELGSRLPAYGYASSPLVVGDTLFVETAGARAAYSAFDKRTGALVWSTQSDRPAYSSPALFTLVGLDQVLFWSATGLHSIGLDGKELWSHPWRTDCPATGDPLGIGTPLFVAPDGVFLSNGSGTALLRISRAGGRSRVETAWASRVMRNDVNSSLLIKDHVYGFDGGTLKCVDVRTGEASWNSREYRKGSLIAADGELIVLGERGEVALVEANPERFVEKSRATVLQGRCWTSPALADGRLYLRNHEELVCLNMRP